MQTEASIRTETRRKLINVLAVCIICILLNLLGAWLAAALHLPLFLDCLGTVLAAIACGYIPGILVGYLTNLINSVSNGINAYYAVLNALIAVLAAFFYRRGWLRKPGRLVLVVICFAIVGGGLGSGLTWLLFGGGFGEGISAPLAHRLHELGGFHVFFSQLYADLLIDLLDKTVVILLVLLILHLLPRRLREGIELCAWQQTPLSPQERAAALKSKIRKASLRSKLMILISAALLVVAVVTTCISFLLFHRFTVEHESGMGTAVAKIAAGMINAERVDDFIRCGDTAEGYAETEKQLQSIWDSHPDIEYVYVYQIREDGCHVVFDMDTEDTPGAEPGEIVEFDESFAPYLPALLAGERIDPLITNDTFGWLLTAYEPVYNAEGRCVCYAAVDISMADLLSAEMILLAKSASLFLGVFVLILALGLWLTEFSVVLPINTMAGAAGHFALSTEESRGEGVEAINRLGIRTGDEIENLYMALRKTSQDMAQYVADVHEKNDTINRMQNSLIAVLADMVESRDKYTGDHVKKTADYSRIILEEMRKEGKHKDVLTEEYIEDVVHSAPLHDVGKIQVSDTLLNKPGKLTDEEFVLMQRHTLAGGEILTRAVDAVSGAEYLSEAENLAVYHHEHWDGKGYPYGIQGEEIPLSARVMAVADVFDALVSKRSYKNAFSIDKALDIIREGIGTHFDPEVANAFLNAEAQVRKVAEEHGDGNTAGGGTA